MSETTFYKQEKLLEGGDCNGYSSKYIRDNIKPTGFHNLPIKILLKIFKYLNEDDIRKSVLPICHKWRQVAVFPELWKKLTFKGNTVPANYIFQQLRTFANLEEIDLIEVPNVANILRRICKYNTQIVKITVKNCNDEKLPERVLRNLVASCRNLEEINLKGTPFSGNLFFMEAAVLPSLKRINIGNNEFLTTKNIFELILNTSKLEELKISNRDKNQNMSDSDAIFLFSNLQNKLKSVTFDMAGLSDVAFNSLLECEKLEKLYLYNATNLQSETFTDFWRKIPKLKYLKIHNCQLASQDFVKLFSSRKVYRNMQLLNLTGCWKLNAAGLKAISKNCKNLKKGIFKCCKNLEDITDLLENCKQLEILNLSFCMKIPDDQIIAAAQKLPKLKVFYIESTRDIEKMKYYIPNLTIYICQSEFNNNLSLVQ